MTQPASAKLLAIIQKRRQIGLEELLLSSRIHVESGVLPGRQTQSSKINLLAAARVRLRVASRFFACLQLAFFRGRCRAVSTQAFNTFSDIPIGRILTPDPAIGLQRFCDPTQCFQRAP
jgi:hypothetical protein